MIYVGIDVASKKHDVCVLNADGSVLKSLPITNDKDGFEQLLSVIGANIKCSEDVKIGLESTGHYSINITKFLTSKRLSVKTYNPLLVSRLRKAETLRKTKTDKSDSKFLARLLMTDESTPYLPSSYPISELKILTRNRSRLVAMRSKLKVSISRLVTVLFPELPDVVWSVNQTSCYALLLAYPTAKDIAGAHIVALTNLLSNNSRGKYGREKALEIRKLAQNSIGLNSRAMGFELKQNIRLIQNLEAEIDDLEAEIDKMMDDMNSPITSVPGIGNTLGAIILSEIGNIENFANPAKLLAFAGMEPSVSQSGNYTASDTPMVKHGSPYLRWALMQAARLVAYRCPVFHTYSQKKLDEGKHYFVVQTHVAKKLIRVLFSLLNNGEVFDEALAA